MPEFNFGSTTTNETQVLVDLLGSIHVLLYRVENKGTDAFDIVIDNDISNGKRLESGRTLDVSFSNELKIKVSVNKMGKGAYDFIAVLS